MIKRIALALVVAGGLGATVLSVAHSRENGHGGMPMGRMMHMAPAERDALLTSRLAEAKTGLALTGEQEKLWPAVETAVREHVKTMVEQGETRKAAGRPADPLEGLRRMANAQTARADSLRKLVDAAQPLYNSLSDDQKKRVPRLMRAGRG